MRLCISSSGFVPILPLSSNQQQMPTAVGTRPGQARPARVARPGMSRLRLNAEIARSPWTISIVAILVYLFVVHSYKIGLGSAAIAVGLFATLAQERPLRLFPSLYWFAAFLAWSIITVPGSVNATDSFNAWIEAAKILLIVFLMVNAVRTPQQHRLITLGWLGLFALYPIRGVLFNFLAGNATAGRYAWNFAFSNPNDLAALSLIPFAMSMERLRSTDKKWVKICAWAGLLMIPFVILITQSRGGELGMAMMFLYLIARSRYRLKLAITACVIGVGGLMFAPQSVWDRIQAMTYLSSVATLGQSDSSAEQRYVILQVAEAIVADNPVSGVGIGNYGAVHEVYARNRPEWALAGGPRDTHNTYLHVLAESGAIGLVLFLMIFISAYYELVKKVRSLKHSNRPGDHIIRDRCQAYQAAYVGLAVCATFGSLHTFVFPYLLVALSMVAVRMQPAYAGKPMLS